MADLVAAVDVGTASARAGILDRTGCLLGRATHPIAIHRPAPDRGEHDSEDIWNAVSAALRAARAQAGARPEAVAGLAFDATCSLVLRDRGGRPLPLGPGGDTLAWFDHRAGAEAALCEATGHEAVTLRGGTLSPETQIPKLIWLKRRAPETWARLGSAFDLADFLFWRATGRPVRSRCTLVCKWGLDAAGDGWPDDFHAAIGLADLAERCALGPEAVPVGMQAGRLGGAGAKALGLPAGIAVAAGLVDAHAGALGVLGAYAGSPEAERRFALIAGTSTCVMAFARDEKRVRGLWGPYRDVALPGAWMVEGGQSASGALLDLVAGLWGGAADEAAHARIWARIAALREAEGPDLAPRLHVLPDIHGNRSPFADPRMLGAISGLSLDRSFDGLCRLYWRAALANALGLRQIVETMVAQGLAGGPLHLAGGLGRSPLLPQLYADAIGRPVVLSEAPDAMLLGTAMAAACGAGLYPDLAAAARAMAAGERRVEPDPAAEARMERDYAALLLQQRHRREIEALVASG